MLESSVQIALVDASEHTIVSDSLKRATTMPHPRYDNMILVDAIGRCWVQASQVLPTPRVDPAPPGTCGPLDADLAVASQGCSSVCSEAPQPVMLTRSRATADEPFPTTSVECVRQRVHTRR